MLAIQVDPEKQLTVARKLLSSIRNPPIDDLIAGGILRLKRET